MIVLVPIVYIAMWILTYGVLVYIAERDGTRSRWSWGEPMDEGRIIGGLFWPVTILIYLPARAIAHHAERAGMARRERNKQLAKELETVEQDIERLLRR